MAARTKTKEMIIKLARFEEEERSALCQYLASGNNFPEEMQKLMTLVMEGHFCRHYGLLALLYNCRSELLSQFREEERQTARYFTLRWSSYMRAFEKWKAPVEPAQGVDKHLEREAIRVLSSNQVEQGLNYSDYYNARRMIEDWGENLRFCRPLKKWLIWDDRRWKKDESGEVYELAWKTVLHLSRKMPECPSTEEAEALMNHAKRSTSARRVESMLTTVSTEPEIRILPSDMDRDLFFFNCANGILDLRSGRLIPHDRQKMMTRVSPIAYMEDACCPTWKRFLRDIFDGNRELIRFVQKFLGCCLSGDMSCQCMFILHGNGANGKSTFINIISTILGDYAVATPTETFMQKKGDQATNDIASLKGARFVSATETDERNRLAESVIKRLTGNDVISARFLYGEYFSFTPTFKIVMATNHKPRVQGNDHAIWRRLRLIPFSKCFPEEKQDKKLPEKLKAESSGILRWMVEGCLKWQKEGLGSAMAINKATDEYRHEMSDIQMFLSDRCRKDEMNMVQSSILYGHYTDWCEKNKERPRSNRNFSIMLSESGMDKVRQSKGVQWLGISLKKPEEEETPY